jgi:hypothetical protein
MSPGMTWESSRSLDDERADAVVSWVLGGGQLTDKESGKETKARYAHKLSSGPNTFVGIAEVKLHPNSSLYALYHH